MLAGAVSATAGTLLAGSAASSAAAEHPRRSAVPWQQTADGRGRLSLEFDGPGRGVPVRLPLPAGRRADRITVTSTTGHVRLSTDPEGEKAAESVTTAPADGLPGEAAVWVTPVRVGAPGTPADRLRVESPAGTRTIEVWIEPVRGRWMPAGHDSAELDLEIVSVHAALMRKGDGAEVVMWSPARETDDEGQPLPHPSKEGKWQWQAFHMGDVESRALDVATLRTRPTPMDADGRTAAKNIFCAGQAQLPDGRLLVAGGHVDPDHPDHDDAAGLHVYDPETGWSKAGDLGVPRWYPSVTTLPDGRMLITGGSLTVPVRDPKTDSGPDGYWNTIHNDYVIYHDGRLITPPDNRLIDPELLPDRQGRLATYPNLFVLPGGPGSNPVVAMVETNRAWLYHYASQARSPLRRAHRMYPMHCAGSRSYPTYGAPVLLPLQPGSARARILVVGGQHETQRDHRLLTRDQPATATAEIFEVDARRALDQQAGWRRTASMSRPRVLCDATLLADGSVLISGGSERGWGDMNTVHVYEAELFDPVSETFRPAAKAATDRRYHSTALLQPDGTVLKAGSTGGFALDSETGESLFDEHTTAERYYPPYLWRGPRPAITEVDGGSAPWSPLGYGGTVTVSARGDGLDEAARLALVKCGSTTHGWDMDQRFVWLAGTAEQVAPGQWTITGRTPADAATAPPGSYLMFLVDSSGVPSPAHPVTVGAGG
jgi:hypothetical protein